MKSLKEIMEEMGFNKEAPLDSQKAFIRHLVAAANQQSITPVTKAQSAATEVAKENAQPAQLEFDFTGGKRVS